MRVHTIKYRFLSTFILLTIALPLMSFKDIGSIKGQQHQTSILTRKSELLPVNAPIPAKKTNQEIVVDWYKNVDTGNYAELKKLMDKKYSFTNSMSPLPADGTTHIAMLTMFSSAISEMKHTYTRFVNDGEWIAVYGKVTGKHTGDFNGIAPTNKTISNTWMHLFHIIDGKVADAYFEMNPATIVNQISGH